MTSTKKIVVDCKSVSLGRCQAGDLFFYDAKIWMVLNRSGGEAFVRDVCCDYLQESRTLDTATRVEILDKITKISEKFTFASFLRRV